MPSKPSKKFDPARRKRSINILEWSTPEVPGTEFVWQPSKRQDADHKDDSRPFYFGNMKKVNVEDYASNDIITFRERGSDGVLLNPTGGTVIRRSRFLSGEIDEQTPIKKHEKSYRNYDIINFENRMYADNTNEINYKRPRNYRKECYGARGDQVGAIMGSQRHMDAIAKTCVEQEFGTHLVLRNAETRYDGDMYRSLPTPYQTYYDIQKRPTYGDTNAGDRFRTTF